MAKNTRRMQTPKSRNEDWMRARLDHANRENTVPSAARYNRKKDAKHKHRQFADAF